MEKSDKKIKVYRIMSIDELKKYIKGEELIASSEQESSQTGKYRFCFADDLYELSKPNDPKSKEPRFICEFIADEESFKRGSDYRIISYYPDIPGLVDRPYEFKVLRLDTYSGKKLKMTSCAYLGYDYLEYMESEDRLKEIEEEKEIVEFISKFDSEKLYSDFYYAQREENDRVLRNIDVIRNYILERFSPFYILNNKKKVIEELDKTIFDPDDFADAELEYQNGKMEEPCYDEDEMEGSYTPEDIEEGIDITESDLSQIEVEVISK